MPWHNKRIWSIDINEDGTLTERTVDYVMEFFTEYSAMVGCTAFYVNGHLWVNNSISENGFQEYAVIKVEKVEAGFVIGNQIESITIQWALRTPDLMREFIAAPEPDYQLPVRLALGHGKRCALCA